MARRRKKGDGGRRRRRRMRRRRPFFVDANTDAPYGANNSGIVARDSGSGTVVRPPVICCASNGCILLSSLLGSGS
eukprot:6278526-Pyramimonas_sp.AAC.1